MRSIALCSSKRHATEIAAWAQQLRQMGCIVFEPNFCEPIPEDSGFASTHVKAMVFKGITFEHFEWIKRADICFVLNLEETCGASVTLEMGYAFALGKIIAAYNPNTSDPCRDALIDFVTPTPEKLFSLVQGVAPQQLLR